MEGGFDMQAYKQSLSGNPDRALLVTFGWEPKKLKDGSFKNIEMIRIFVDKNNEVTREVTPEDKVRFSDRYTAFKAGTDIPPDGTPISQCAFATPADVATCKGERVYTVEQLVEMPDERLQRSRLVNFKYKCRDWLESQKRHGYIGELRDQIEALKAQVAALKEQHGEPAEVIVPKKRGRPRKNVEDAVTTG